eukprot:CAMPEP_0202390720 /NCGR_PEP_ID=MMETSP1127-20130417/90205_1 /ASSEMBLY_ACC=CAM_ASM_000462 /TAXON_ID=3047 /ORGANISM="Dunaliella tertiolecta, Strain CCMP1320" /LENGTH=78 /DNA_ID=CAMNT_0048993035 /DNA_START=189 /DNA_END=421 /DNA_ORIENTATION=+
MAMPFIHALGSNGNLACPEKGSTTSRGSERLLQGMEGCTKGGVDNRPPETPAPGLLPRHEQQLQRRMHALQLAQGATP